jgi:hypothetical protein
VLARSNSKLLLCSSLYLEIANNPKVQQYEH